MSDVRAFGPFRFDPLTLELFHQGVRVPLEPMPARILGRLLERAGEMVPRDELLQLGWPKLPEVADASLNTCVRQIRAALGDDAGDPRWVETLRGRGYRFKQQVRVAPSAGATVTPRNAGRRRPLRIYAAVAAVVSLPVLVVGLRGRDGIDPDLRSALTKAEMVLDRYQDPRKALELVDTLVGPHPDVARVHTLRAELLLMLGRVDDAAGAVSLGLSMDPDDAVGLRVRSSLDMFAGRWAEAERALDGALRSDPDAAGSWVARAYLSTIRGRFDEAAEAIARALELDPLSPTVQGDVGQLHLWAGRYEEAARSCREVVALAPEPPAWAIECAFDALTLVGREDEALSWAVPLMVEARLLPAAVEATEPAGGSETARSVRVARLRVIRGWAARGSTVPPYVMALACARAGENDAALDALERAGRSPGFGLLSAAVDPRFAALRSEPRFLTLVRRLGLEPVGQAEG